MIPHCFPCAQSSTAFGQFAYTYDVATRLKTQRQPNGVELTFTRDARGRLTTAEHRTPAALVEQIHRPLDPVGNVLSRTRPGRPAQTFGYDALDRLLSVAAGADPQEVYAFDQTGNWTTGQREHDLANQLLADALATFAHDHDGNLTTITGPDENAAFGYDPLNRLVTVTTAEGTVTHRYDALGRRYATLTANQTRLVLFDGWEEIAATDATGVLRPWQSLGGLRQAVSTGAGNRYLHLDLDGSVIAATDETGAVVERYDYSAFGDLTVRLADGTEAPADHTPASPWLYHGRPYESETGLYWMRARHYSPALGRFLQRDPIGLAGGINLYAYVSNNPLRWSDPWGTSPKDAGQAFAPNNPERWSNEKCAELRAQIEGLKHASSKIFSSMAGLGSRYTNAQFVAGVGFVGGVITDAGVIFGAGSALAGVASRGYMQSSLTAGLSTRASYEISTAAGRAAFWGSTASITATRAGDMAGGVIVADPPSITGVGGIVQGFFNSGAEAMISNADAASRDMAGALSRIREHMQPLLYAYNTHCKD